MRNLRCMPEYRRNHPITSALRGWYYAAYVDEPQRKHHHRSRFKSLQVINASFSKSKQRNHSSEANGNHSSQGNDMTIHNSLSELIGNTPLVKLNHVTDGHQSHHRSQSRIFQSWRLLQRPHCGTHHRRGRTQRRTQAGRCDCGTDLRQHRRRTCPRGPAARIPHHLHPARQGFRSQACGTPRIRCRSGGNPYRCWSG